MPRPKGSKNKPKYIDTSVAGEIIPPEPVKVPRAKREVVEKTVHKGFINIQANPRGGFYCGGDIHPTLESAKAMASKPTVTQLYIAFEA